MTCDSCGQPVEPTISKAPDGSFTSGEGNELYVTLDGGYGSFVDTAECVGGKPYTYTLCHSCAVKLCVSMGFIDALREHSNMVDCPCPGREERQARFDAAVAAQRAGLP